MPKQDYVESMQLNLDRSYSMLVTSFKRGLEAANKSPRTIITYLESLTYFGQFLKEHGMNQDPIFITREYVEMFISEQLGKNKPSTAATRYRSLNVFFNWLVEEGEIKESPMKRMKQPKVPITPPDLLTEDQRRAILQTCNGKSFNDQRDTAILRLLIDTGMRKSEIGHIMLSDIDFNLNVIRVVQKGGNIKVCPFGKKTAQALDRYLRIRERTEEKDIPNLWLGQKKGGFGAFGVYEVVKKRCSEAGIEHALAGISGALLHA